MILRSSMILDNRYVDPVYPPPRVNAFWVSSSSLIYNQIEAGQPCNIICWKGPSHLGAGVSLNLQLGRELGPVIGQVLAGNVSRRQRNTGDGAFGNIFDMGDILDVIVAVANAPEHPGAERKGHQ